MGELEAIRDKFVRWGPGVVHDSELLGLILGTGHSPEPFKLSRHLLNDGLFGIALLPITDILQKTDIGVAKACQIRAVFELATRLSHEAARERPAIKSPAEAAALLMPEMSLLEQEHLRVILLDTRNRVMGIDEVYHGSLNTSMIRVGELFRSAIRRNAAAIIMAHNHPSGDPSPSPEDVSVTKAAVEAGKLLDIDTLDSLIIGANRFTSLKERGLGF